MLPTSVLANTPTIIDAKGVINTGQILTISGTYMTDQVEGDFGLSNGSFEGSSITSDDWAECVVMVISITSDC